MKELTKAEKEYIIEAMLIYLTGIHYGGEEVTLKNYTSFKEEEFELIQDEDYNLIISIIKKLSTGQVKK